MTSEHNGKFCLYCEKPLVGKQTRYCGDIHRQRHKRQLKKESSTNQTDQTSDHSTGNDPQNAIELFEQVKRDLARSEGMIVTLTEERDKLRSERNTLSDRLIESEKQNGVLQGKLEVVEVAQPTPQEPPATTSGPNYALWAVGALLIIVVVVLIVVAVQTFGG